MRGGSGAVRYSRPHRGLTPLLSGTSARGWPVLVAGLTLRSFRLLHRAFRVHTSGHEPFDFHNRRTVGDVAAPLPAYTAQSRQRYQVFFVEDLVFPLVGRSWDCCWRCLAAGLAGSAVTLARHAL